MSRLTAFLLLLVCAAPVQAAEPAVLSVGSGHAITATLTFDRRKAAQGGFIFATRTVELDDVEAIRLSEGLLTGVSGMTSFSARTARRHSVPALALPAARWDNGALFISEPVFSDAPGVFKPVVRFDAKRLAEGDVVTLDARRGVVVLVDPARQALELELSAALRAYDGLGSLQALLQWYDARPSGPSAELASRLIEEISARVAAGSVPAAQFARLRMALDAGLSSEGRRISAVALAEAARRQTRVVADAIEDLHVEAASAGSRTAALKLAQEGRRRADAAKALANAAGKPQWAELAEKALRKLDEAAKKRAAVLPAAVSPEAALVAAGATRPTGRTVPAAFYTRFVSESGVGEKIAVIVDDASLILRDKEKRLEAAFTATPMSAALKAELVALAPKSALLSVCSPEGCEEKVAAEKIEEGVRRVWSYSWFAGPLGRRKRDKISFAAPNLTLEAVEVGAAAGTAYSRDPVTGRSGRLVVSCGVADERVLDRSLHEALPPISLDPAKPCLSAEQAVAAARATRALDDATGQGVELSFSFSGGKLIARSWKPLEL